jgi:hypothetical protein
MVAAVRAFASSGSTAVTTAVAERAGSMSARNMFAGGAGARVVSATGFSRRTCACSAYLTK